MLIELKCNGPVADKANLFLSETYSLISGFVKLEQLLADDPMIHYDEEYKAMGVPIEECILLCIEEIIADLNIDHLADITCRGYFGESLATKKYMGAQTALETIYKRIKCKIENMDPYTLAELKDLRAKIAYALGDIIYAFSSIIFEPSTAREVVETPSAEITYCHDLQRFFASLGKTSIDLAVELIQLQETYVSVIPLFENDPEAWYNITETLPPSIVDILIEYGTYITPLDVRAFTQGILKIDEVFIDTLVDRAENLEYIGNVAPVEWLSFIQLIPDKYVQLFMRIDDALTPDMLQPALEARELTEAHIAEILHTLKGGEEGATITRHFQ